MKYTLRARLCLLLALCLALPLTACDGGSFRDDLTAAQVCDAVTAALSAEDGWRQVSENYISPSSWGEDYADYLEMVAEYRIVVSENSEINIDEVGVFLCKSEKDAKAVKTFCENYLAAKALQMKRLLESYNPDELPKLDYATVNVMGRYVMYSILSSADTTAAGSAMEKALTPSA
ncbi:MAG: DUF4358 domain-containing protein [Clostridia bacterium]|nr:DUF4358 domain-containing protein [Clostridia bacterium]